MNTATGTLPPAARRRLDAGTMGNWLLVMLLVALTATLALVQVEPWQWQLPSGARLWGAGALLLGHAALIGVVRIRRDDAAGLEHAGFVEPAHADWVVAHASQTGQAEILAGLAATALRAPGHAVALVPLSALDPTTLHQVRKLLVVASTTGEGDPPDNAWSFVRRCMGDASLRLDRLEYGLLALGDRAYGDFCAFGHMLDDWLRSTGARPLFETIEVDDSDVDALRRWDVELGRLGAVLPAGAPGPAQTQAWRLHSRSVLNPGSPGAPVHDLVLEPVATPAPTWEAGDIAVVQPPGCDSTREYSIASVPSEGRLRLLVREQSRADGSPGLGSSWLAHGLAVGTELPVRLRSNPRFHAPPDARPLVLVGNGTGVAGLRALLRARIDAGHHRNWLLFGERAAAHDFHYGAELGAWQAAGALARLELAFSRDPGELHYVQDLVTRHGSELKRWVADGASIYVCGSLRGMAPGVDAALEALLGREVLDELAANGRYCRDVY